MSLLLQPVAVTAPGGSGGCGGERRGDTSQGRGAPGRALPGQHILSYLADIILQVIQKIVLIWRQILGLGNQHFLNTMFPCRFLGCKATRSWPTWCPWWRQRWGHMVMGKQIWNGRSWIIFLYNFNWVRSNITLIYVFSQTTYMMTWLKEIIPNNVFNLDVCLMFTVWGSKIVCVWCLCLLDMSFFLQDEEKISKIY